MLHYWIRPFKASGGQLTPKSCILFKNLFVRIYIAKCTEIDMGAFGAYLNVKLCSTWRMAMSSTAEKDAERASFILALNTETNEHRTKFAMEHQVDEFFGDFARHLVRSF